jgi:hypothetical protein
MVRAVLLFQINFITGILLGLETKGIYTGNGFRIVILIIRAVLSVPISFIIGISLDLETKQVYIGNGFRCS